VARTALPLAVVKLTAQVPRHHVHPLLFAVCAVLRRFLKSLFFSANCEEVATLETIGDIDTIARNRGLLNILSFCHAYAATT
jgi:hypothetical protein